MLLPPQFEPLESSFKRWRRAQWRSVLRCHSRGIHSHANPGTPFEPARPALHAGGRGAPISRRHNFRDSICVLGATLGKAHFCFYVRQRRDLFRHLGKAHAQLLSHRAPGSTRIPHALSRMNSASAAKPSHCILHCARRCRLLGASVGVFDARCDAAALGAHRAGLLRARRGYLVASLVSASAAQLLWSTSGPKGPRRRFRRRVPVNPGRRAGEAARETAAGRAGRRATGDLPPQIRPEACPGASLAPLRPRGVAPGPSHAG